MKRYERVRKKISLLQVVTKTTLHFYMLLIPTDLKETIEGHIMFLRPNLQTKGILLLAREGRNEE